MPGISENPLGDPYILALLNLTDNLPRYHAIKAEDMHMEQRAKFVLEQLDPTLRALVDRPKKVKMMKINGIDELGVFCQALQLGWRLWPVIDQRNSRTAGTDCRCWLIILLLKRCWRTFLR